MIEIAELDDVDYMDRIVREPVMWAAITDDSCGKPEEFCSAKALGPRDVPLLVKEDGLDRGFFVFLALKDDLWEQHNCITGIHGANAVEAAKLAIQWIKKHRKWSKFVTFCFSDTPAVERHLTRVGYVFTGKSGKSSRLGHEVDILNFELGDN